MQELNIFQKQKRLPGLRGLGRLRHGYHGYQALPLLWPPCMVEEWGLEAWEKPILDRWNEINLYTMTRGINRFKGPGSGPDRDRQAVHPIEGWKSYRLGRERPGTLQRGPRQGHRDRQGSCPGQSPLLV